MSTMKITIIIYGKLEDNKLISGCMWTCGPCVMWLRYTGILKILSLYHDVCKMVVLVWWIIATSKRYEKGYVAV
jgi:hypothetical protein